MSEEIKPWDYSTNNEYFPRFEGLTPSANSMLFLLLSWRKARFDSYYAECEQRGKKPSADLARWINSDAFYINRSIVTIDSGGARTKIPLLKLVQDMFTAGAISLHEVMQAEKLFARERPAHVPTGQFAVVCLDNETNQKRIVARYNTHDDAHNHCCDTDEVIRDARYTFECEKITS